MAQYANYASSRRGEGLEEAQEAQVGEDGGERKGRVCELVAPEDLQTRRLRTPENGEKS